MASALMPPASVKLTQRILQLPPSIRRALFSTATQTSSPELYDLVCIGGGPAGLSLISSLRSHPATQRLKVALIDSQDLTTSRSSNDAETYSNRCSSLTPASVKFLRSIGAWDKIEKARIQNYHGMDVWDGVSGSKISFDPLDARGGFGGGLLDYVAELVPGSSFRETRRRDEIDVGAGEGAVATMCENQNLTAALLQRMNETESVDVLDKTKVDSIELGPEPQDEASVDLSQWPIVNLSGSRQLAARLLIGADGANSPVRNFADIRSDGWDYNQHGIVATLHIDQKYSEYDLRTAYQRFLPTGPIALLPLPNNRASLVWSISTNLAPKVKSLPPSSFTALINAAFRMQQTDLSFILNHLTEDTDIADELSWRLPNTPASSTGLPRSLPQITAVQEGSIASFPLRMRHAATYTGHRVALIGDAAHTVHPLAGQGLNLGLADSQSLAKSIVYGVEHGMDIGTSWCLESYLSERWAANNAVMGVCDKLQKIYSASSGPVVWGRSLGVDVLERLGGLKGAIMGAAGTR